MFSDWTEALEAESLPLDPNPAQQLAAAARVTARSSRDKDDMALLLDVLGLPTDTLTALLPLIPETGDAPTMTNTPAAPALSAHEAMAISMHNNGDSEQAIREATGLSETELSDLIADRILGLPRAAAAPAIDIPAIPLAVPNEVQKLLDWAAAHPAASIRSRAARITADLSELTDRRDSEAAQREAEEKVAKAKAELEKAQEELRTLKAGTRTTAAATAAAAPTPIRAGLGSGRTREELAAIRTWAREHGHQVADQGMVPKRVLEAYDAAHQAPVRKPG
ncbi:histone-like nucleoid-structuring protein Lsr2 [Streptomyces sp. NPDC047718]|uniref:Lsr2 family DNA-binding protein n=1 Tax=Streptomyces sp. NPDC047718 TaxID=3155479 RepID=UPI0033DC53D5